jgi:Flp pilus assembly protein TadB
MNLNNLQTKLVASARAIPPDERVPYAFEKRIMARLASGGRLDLLSAWSHALGRAAVSCVAIMLLSGAWFLWSDRQQNETDFSQELETAVLASAGSVDEAW